MLIAKAWAKALDDGGDPRDLVAGDLLQAIRTVQYVGVTGNVTLNAGGNTATAKYTIHQVSATRCSSSPLNSPANGPTDTRLVSSTPSHPSVPGPRERDRGGRRHDCGRRAAGLGGSQPDGG